MANFWEVSWRKKDQTTSDFKVMCTSKAQVEQLRRMCSRDPNVVIFTVTEKEVFQDRGRRK